MEDSLTLEELYGLQEAMFRAEYRHNKFLAALKGIDLDAETSDSQTFEEIQRQAQAQLAGVSEQEYTFEQIGIAYESDDE